MEGCQFTRMETYSVQGAPGKATTGSEVRKSGARAWTAEEVFQEAERHPLASLHVSVQGIPPEIVPGTVGTFAARGRSMPRPRL